MSANDDQRMRELIDRLVAMSPEPPPFPEEVTVTTPKPGPKRNPILMFAGAAVIVLLVAFIPIILSGGGNTPAGSSIPGVVDTTTTVTDDTSPTTAPVATTSTLPEQVVAAPTVVYLLEDPANSNQGNPAMVAFATSVDIPGDAFTSDTAVVQATLELLTNPQLQPPSDRFWNAVPNGVEVLGVNWVDGTADSHTLIIDMSGQFLAGAGGLLADTTVLNQLIYTATQQGLGLDVGQVQFTVNGEPITAFGTEGIDLTDPVDRTTFENELNPIVITQPVNLEGDDLPMVTGRANVFEAAVSLQIVESESGEVVYEDNTTATQGSGLWGDFSFSLDTPALTPDRLILVFWYSAKDGTPSDVVTIPLSPNPTWALLPDQG